MPKQSAKVSMIPDTLFLSLSVSLSGALASSDEPFCRICHEGGTSGELLSPCECSGTLAMVHRACLEHWLTSSNSSHCELCHYQFSLERLPKPFTEVRIVCITAQLKPNSGLGGCAVALG